jgi:Single-strand binding protein family
MPDTHVTITGNLTDDPEVTFTPNGAAVCNFRVAVTARIKDGDAWRDGDTSFYRITAWRALAEHVGDSLSKGHRGSWSASSGPVPGRPPRGSAAAWSRSRPRRSAPRFAGPPPSPSAPPTARRLGSSTTTRRFDPWRAVRPGRS